MRRVQAWPERCERPTARNASRHRPAALPRAQAQAVLEEGCPSFVVARGSSVAPRVRHSPPAQRRTSRAPRPTPGTDGFHRPKTAARNRPKPPRTARGPLGRRLEPRPLRAGRADAARRARHRSPSLPVDRRPRVLGARRAIGGGASRAPLRDVVPSESKRTRLHLPLAGSGAAARASRECGGTSGAAALGAAAGLVGCEVRAPEDGFGSCDAWVGVTGGRGGRWAARPAGR